jgi:S1-C subfamily serine protease
MKIVVISGADPGHSYDVSRELVLGRLDPADIVIVDPRVSGRHARVQPSPGGIIIEDLGSSNGTLVDGVAIIEPRELRGGETIQVGDTKLRVEGAKPPPPPHTAPSPPPGASVSGWQVAVRTGPNSGLTRGVAEGESVVIGRDAACHIQLTDSHVSNRHAEVSQRGGRVFVRDLESANGTLLNGAPVTQATELRSGAEIQVGESVLVATYGAAPAGGPTPTVLGKVPIELTKSKRSPTTLALAGIAGALVVAGGVTAGVLTLGDDAMSATEVVRANRDATVLILSAQDGQTASKGSGFVIDARRGLIVTNNHVATGGELSVQAEAFRSKKVAATLVGAMPCEDLALVRITDKEALAALDQVTFSDRQFEQGDAAIALGYPGSAEGGQDFEADTLSATSGIVSKVDARYDVPQSGVPLLTSVVQHTAAVNPGNSGGPLFDDRGELIGVNTAIFISRSTGIRSEGENYSVSVKRLRERIGQLTQGGAPKWLGLSLGGTLTTDEGEPVGMAIDSVTPDSPADDAGVRGGLILVGIDDERVTNIHEYCDAVPNDEGDSVRLRLVDPVAGTQGTITVKVGNNDG